MPLCTEPNGEFRRHRRWRLLACSSLLTLGMAPGPCNLSGQSVTLETWLRQTGRFSNSDMRQLRTGAPVVTLLGPDTPRGLSVLGAVRVATTPAHLIALANRPAELLSDASVLAAGEVHIPPRIGDFRHLRIPASDLRELQRCSVGSCKLKLARPFITELALAARGRSSETEGNVTAPFRNMLFSYSDRFIEGGISALPSYADKEEAAAPSLALASLRVLDHTLFGQSRVLTNHLRRYPNSDAQGVTDRLAWTIEDVGLRHTVRLLHLALLQPPDVPAVDAIVGIEQLYASHYLLASVTFLSLITDASVTGDPARYLLMLTRYEFDEEVDGMSRTVLRRSTVVERLRRLRSLQQRLRP